MKTTKNIKVANSKYNREEKYSLDKAISIVKEVKFSKFDESIDIAINLNVNPRHAEENIRVNAALPHGTGKDVKVLVLCSGPNEKKAKEAGADLVGNEEFLKKIKNGWTDVDKIVATPDMMGELGKLGKILGPKGLMPNPKSGTVTMDVKSAVQALKAGQVEMRVDSNGIIHVPCGKISFDKSKLIENIKVIFNIINKARPASVKGVFITKVSLSSTMGPGILIDKSQVES